MAKTIRKSRNIARISLIRRANAGAGYHTARNIKRAGDRTDNWRRENELDNR